MAEIITFDPKKAEEERIEKEIAVSEEDDRAAYLTMLKNDPRFIQYVKQEIFEDEIRKLGDLDTIPIGDDTAKMGELVIINAACRATLRRILTRML